MYEIKKSFTFAASHQLPEHDGKCRDMHGHTYRVTVALRANSLVSAGPKRGMVADFASVSAAMKPLIEEKLDHKHLNDTLDVYPTSENIARWLYHQLEERLPWQLARLMWAVTVSESPTSEATYVGPRVEVVLP